MQSEINQLVDAVNKLEWVRKQIEDLLGSLEGHAAAEAIRVRANVLQEGGIAVQSRFIDVHLTGGREDSFRNSMKLYGRYIELMRELDGTSDFPPTVQQRQVADVLQGRLNEAVAVMNEFIETELAQFYEFVQQQGVATTNP